jgi:glycogen(starch) synthase
VSQRCQQEVSVRILVVSNFYPPHVIGGYEIGCSDVVEALKSRGHDIRVLTSSYGCSKAEHSGQVFRWLETDRSLHIDGSSRDLPRILRKESINRRAFERLCRDIEPDIVYVWNPTHISLSIAAIAQQKGLPVCFFVSDHWLSDWEADSLYSLRRRSPRRTGMRLIWKPLLAMLQASRVLPNEGPDFKNVQFASHYLERSAQQTSALVGNAEVIHWGIDAERFPLNHTTRTARRLLYAGQLTSLKGVHTAVQALRIVVDDPAARSTMLTIAGGPDYDDRIHRLVSSLRLENNVRFTGFISRDRLQALYKDHDIFLFPSVWDEPFSIALLEAMSSGLAVVGTNTGGTTEILRDEVNALIFPKEDPEACATQIKRLTGDAGLFAKIRLSGRQTVESQFRLEDMVDRVEYALIRLVRQSDANVLGAAERFAHESRNL